MANASVSAISFLTMPIVSRLYSPAEFGNTAFFLSIVGIFAGISSLRYDASIVLTSSSKEARVMFLASLMICILVGFSAWILVIFLNIINPGLLAPLENYLGLFPLAIILFGFSQAVMSFMTKIQRFSQMGIMITSRVFAQQAYRIALGFFGFASALQLILSALIGQGIGLFMTRKDLKRVFVNIKEDRIHLNDLYQGIRRYKNFPLYSSWSYFINLLGIQLPFLVIGRSFGVEMVGFFSVAVLLLGVPQLFSSAISRVLYQRSVVAKSEGNLTELIFEAYKRLIIYGIFPFAVTALYGMELAMFIFGERWAESGKYIQLLSLVYFCIFFSSPLGHLYNVFEKQRVSLKFNLYRILTQLISLILGGLLGNIYIALLAYSVSGSIFRYASISWVLTQAHIKFRSNGVVILKAVSFSLIPLLFIKILDFQIQLPLAMLLCAIGILTLVYYTLSVKNDHLVCAFVKDYYLRHVGRS